MKTTKVQEWTSFAETAVFQHVNDGVTEYETVNEVNRSASPTKKSKLTSLIGRVRVGITVEEDKGVHPDGRNYYKRVESFQERDGGKNETSSYSTPLAPVGEPTEEVPSLDPYASESGNEHKTRTLKNMIDTLWTSSIAQWLVISGLSLLIGVVLFR